jgi:hypothetical protein
MIGDDTATGRLADILRAACIASRGSPDDFTVQARHLDPYRLGRPKSHREGQWFAEWLNRLMTTTARVHLRGFHYVLIAFGGVMKPNGAPYRNTLADYQWLNNYAAKAARWLGYVPFDRFIDKRNDAPVIFRPAHALLTPTTSAVGHMGADAYREIGEDIEIHAPEIHPRLQGFGANQRYCFAFFGEKSSLDDAVRPIAQQYMANMYLCAGEISDTLVWEMARDAAQDGRPLVVFTFSDFDPSGWNMPTTISRRLQALRDLEFPGLAGQVVPVSLTLEQVLAERLPTTPVKSGERRRGKWDDAFGPALRAAASPRMMRRRKSKLTPWRCSGPPCSRSSRTRRSRPIGTRRSIAASTRRAGVGSERPRRRSLSRSTTRRWPPSRRRPKPRPRISTPRWPP